MSRARIVFLLALGVVLSACGDVKVQPLYPGAYFPLARGPN
jgi:hypothetical protein